jgi:1,4-dihydroxy-2-naphthoate octaprenyltransferase
MPPIETQLDSLFSGILIGTISIVLLISALIIFCGLYRQKKKKDKQIVAAVAVAVATTNNSIMNQSNLEKLANSESSKKSLLSGTVDASLILRRQGLKVSTAPVTKVGLTILCR